MSIATEFLSSVGKRFREYKALGEKTFAQLGEDELHLRPNESSTSIATIVQHLHGNMISRWTNFLTEDGEKSWRRRDAEFNDQELTKEQLLQRWEEGWSVFLTTLDSLREEDLLATITIRSQPLIVMDAINRQMAHYSYHVGQIVYLGRWIKNTGWQSLSIPVGGSDAYHQQLKDEQKK
jgi:uncharacterized damage-inducible protein DinB